MKCNQQLIFKENMKKIILPLILILVIYHSCLDQNQNQSSAIDTGLFKEVQSDSISFKIPDTLNVTQNKRINALVLLNPQSSKSYYALILNPAKDLRTTEEYIKAVFSNLKRDYGDYEYSLTKVHLDTGAHFYYLNVLIEDDKKTYRIHNLIYLKDDHFYDFSLRGLNKDFQSKDYGRLFKKIVFSTRVNKEELFLAENTIVVREENVVL
tara:strand:+ start:316 stop:945 length:630 start_codon:yes stop_codon:yes gene_type:complete